MTNKINIEELTKQEIVSTFGKNKDDTGNTAVQIAIITKEISKLSSHVKQHKKDLHSLRGLKMMVSKRNFLMKYLLRTNADQHAKIKEQLSLRK